MNLFTGGYYTIEQKGNKLRIIALNSNAFSTVERQRNVVNPIEQLEWLEKILLKSVMNKETVSNNTLNNLILTERQKNVYHNVIIIIQNTFSVVSTMYYV